MAKQVGNGRSGGRRGGRGGRAGGVRRGVAPAAALVLVAVSSLAAFRGTSSAPSVTGLAPTAGPSFGGNPVTIRGSGLTGVTAVSFGSQPAVFVHVDSDSQVTATAPAQAAGTTVDVRVSAGSAVSAVTAADQYSYVAGVWADTAPMAQGDTGLSATALSGGKALVVGQWAQLFDEASGGWTLLRDAPRVAGGAQVAVDGAGEVVFTGGTMSDPSGTSVVASVESYDSKSGSWPATAAMSVPRAGHSATVLGGPACRASNPPSYCGKVLVAGGYSAAGASSLASAELFDPAGHTNVAGVAVRGAWAAAAPLHIARAGHVAVLLDGGACRNPSPPWPWYCGKVLVAGGDAYGGYYPKYLLSSAELYDPAASTTLADGSVAPGGWTQLGDMPAARYQPLAAALAGGSALVAGGKALDGSDLASAVVFDPSSGTSGAWAAAGSMTLPRPGGALVALADGGALAAGGGAASASAEVYRPPGAGGAGGWAATSSMRTGRRDQAMAVLTSGRVLAAGGADAAGTVLSSAELYDPAPKRTKPTVSGVEPPTGAVAGGTAVTVTGAGFYNPAGTTVSFDDVAATAVVVHSDSELVAVAPPAKDTTQPSVVHVRVTTPLGTSDAGDASRYTYTLGTWARAAALTGCATASPGDCVARAGHQAVLLDGPPCHGQSPPSYCGKVLVMGGTTPTLYSDGATTAGSKTLSIPSASERGRDEKPFVSADVGYAVTGPGIPDDTVIVAVADPAPGETGSTSVTLSNPVTATASGVVFFTRAGTAEIYDPVSGTWTATGRMLAERGAPGRPDFLGGFTATVLDDGKVLVAGGCCGPVEQVGDLGHYVPNALASAEIYDPVSGRWSPTGSMTTPRFGHTATLLTGAACQSPGRPSWCGKVLVTGGAGDTDLFEVKSSTELYDPVSGTWTPLDATMGSARDAHTATFLDINGGEVLVTGGVGHTEPAQQPACRSVKPDALCTETALKTAEVYSLGDSAPAWQPVVGTMQVWRALHTAVVLSGSGCDQRCGQILLVGGAPGANAGDLFDPKTGTWSATGPMVHDRYAGTATVLPGGTVLAAGGLAGADTPPFTAGVGHFSDLGPTAETYDPSTNGWDPTPPMTADRYLHTATLLDGPACRGAAPASWCGHVLVVGGYTPATIPTRLESTEIFTPPPPPPAGTGTGGCPSVGTPGPGQVAYPSGYSLVGLPEGSVVPGDSPLYSWVDQGSGGHYHVDAAGTPMVAGRGYWAWFACPHLVTVASQGTTGVDLPLGAYHASMVANPSGRQPVVVSGFDYAVRWDPTANGGVGGYQQPIYRQAQTLAVGEGIWVFSYTDTTIHIQPAAAS